MSDRFRWTAGALAVACVVAPGAPTRAADDELKPPLTFTAIVRLEGGRISGTRQLGVEMRIDRLTPRDEVWALADQLAGTGQDTLRTILEGRSGGLLRLGVLDFPVNLAVSRLDGHKQTFFLVSARALRVSEVNLGMDSTGYPFGVALFTVDSLGQGEGLVYPAARISLDKDGGVVIENYREQPGALAEVRLKR